MVLRHAMFYYSWGILEEFGTNQPILGIFLIPVTAIFGSLFLYKRYTLELNRYELSKLFLIGLIPLVLNYNDLNNLICYTIYDASRRPKFLILLPIVLSAFIKYLSISKKLIPALVFVYVLSDNFIIHYILLFLIVNEISTKKINQNLIFTITLLFAVPSFLYITPARINIIAEMLVALSLLQLLNIVVKLIPTGIIKISILYFYFSQALLFHLIPNNLEQIITIPVIFISSIIISISIARAEKKIKLIVR